jgi:hypothetical protein
MGPSKYARLGTEGEIGENAVVSVFVGVGCMTVVNSSVGDGCTTGVDVGREGVGIAKLVAVAFGTVGAVD